MPRKPLQRTNTLPYHVTARANNREDFHLPLSRFWELMGDECLHLTLVYEVEIQSLVLMPNHFHMILTVPQHDLGQVMNSFMSSISRSANRISGRSGHVFGGPYHWSLINSSRYFGHAFKYVYRNPVRAKLCDQVEDYSYSTLWGLLGRSSLPFPLYFTRAGMELGLPAFESQDQLHWLNHHFPTEIEILIQRGLRRKLFEADRSRESRNRCSPLDRLF